MEINEPLANKEAYIIDFFKTSKKAVIALSGGSDSALLTVLAANAIGENVVAVTVKGSMVPDEETKDAIDLCANLGIECVLIDADEFSIEQFRNNRKDRCYHCKKSIMQKIRKVAEAREIYTVCDGTNHDDLNVHRPGLKATAELCIKKPLADAKISKKEVYELLKKYEFAKYIKPPMSCMATRFPENEELTKEKLNLAYRAEKLLRDAGITGYMRVRIKNEAVTIECEPSEYIKIVSLNVSEKLKKLGFLHISLKLD